MDECKHEFMDLGLICALCGDTIEKSGKTVASTGSDNIWLEDTNDEHA